MNVPPRKILVFGTLAAAVIVRNRINTALGLPRCSCLQHDASAARGPGPYAPDGVPITSTIGVPIQHPVSGQWALRLRGAVLLALLTGAEQAQLADLTADWLPADPTP